MVSLRGSVGTGKKENESSTGRVWAAGFHHVTACSRLVHIFKLMKCLISFCFGPRPTVDIELTDTVVHLCKETVVFDEKL